MMKVKMGKMFSNENIKLQLNDLIKKSLIIIGIGVCMK